MKKLIFAVLIFGYSISAYSQEVTVKEKTKSKVHGPVVEKKVIKEEKAQPSVSVQKVTTTTSHNAYRSPRSSGRHYINHNRHYRKHYSHANRKHYVSTSHHYAKVHRFHTKTYHNSYKEIKRKNTGKKSKLKYKY